MSRRLSVMRRSTSLIPTCFVAVALLFLGIRRVDTDGWTREANDTLTVGHLISFARQESVARVSDGQRLSSFPCSSAPLSCSSFRYQAPNGCSVGKLKRHGAFCAYACGLVNPILIMEQLRVRKLHQQRWLTTRQAKTPQRIETDHVSQDSGRFPVVRLLTCRP
ncbi:hypothetical protein HDV57DRAFT_112914 [Trichoderma longibrachiatum]